MLWVSRRAKKMISLSFGINCNGDAIAHLRGNHATMASEALHVYACSLNIASMRSLAALVLWVYTVQQASSSCSEGFYELP
jgi:hypothetical protein